MAGLHPADRTPANILRKTVGDILPVYLKKFLKTMGYQITGRRQSIHRA